jgi:endonuclease/exonuclease/phosphatase family metal-dependent hydrolase
MSNRCRTIVLLGMTFSASLLLLVVPQAWVPELPRALVPYGGPLGLRDVFGSPQRNTGDAVREAARHFAGMPRVKWRKTYADNTSAPSQLPSAAVRGAANGTRGGSTLVRLLHWNILDGGVTPLEGGVRSHGARGGMSPRRIDGIAALLASRRYDVVCLNELNGFESAQLRALGGSLGMPHTALLARSRYHLGILSRAPFDIVLAERTAPFAHGLLCVRLRASGLEVCCTHLDPLSSRARALEARRIAAHARARAAAGRPLVLLGDLNTLSPLDAPRHREGELLGQIRHGPHAASLERKFVATDGGGGARLDYRPMQLLLDVPLTDLGARSGSAAHTVPTRLAADHMHFARMRLDFCLVGQHVARACDEGARRGRQGGAVEAAQGACAATVLITPETEQLSDHFPLEVAIWVPPPLNSNPGH